MPRFRDAVYGGETVVLENRHLRLEVHKRRTGWGWGELFVPDGQGGWRFFAVLEHLAELDAEGLPHALRMEAPEVTLTSEGGVETLRFAVRTQAVSDAEAYYGGESPLAGTVELALGADDHRLSYRMELISQFGFRLKRLRGPWLLVGADSFGSDKTDAIFPGIDWVLGREWSSGTDYMEHPERLRVTPHPHKVAIPCLAISQGGMGLGLWYEPEAQLTVDPGAYPSTLIRFPQPVFATPDFISNRERHVLGLMWPSARKGLQENALEADPPLNAGRARFVSEATIAVVPGTSLDVVLDWVHAHGLPDPGQPRWPFRELVERIVRAYDTTYWADGEGWAPSAFYRGKKSIYVPEVVTWYLAEGQDQALVQSLQRKVDWVKAQNVTPSGGYPDPAASPYDYVKGHPAETVSMAERLLALQTPEGDFPYQPEGRHRASLGSLSAFWRPLGQEGDSTVDFCATAVLALFQAHDETQREDIKAAIKKTLDFALRFQRPEGGDWWETPVKSPNLLAAGNAANAYARGYRLFGDERYRAAAVRWMRSVLPFTHLWEATDVKMLYNTKPCLNNTAWYLSDWTSKHVEWEVLKVLAEAHALGIDWAALDPDVDWKRYHRGVATAVQRWMVDHTDPEWMFRSEFPPEWTKDGGFDLQWTDTFDPVNNSYGGGPIAPSSIARNFWILAQEEDAQ